MPIPGVPITTVPNEGDPNFPALAAIQTVDSVGPSAANRQPNQLRTRDGTLRDRVNKLIDATTFIAQGAAASTDYYLPRDGTRTFLGTLNMNNNRIDNIRRISMETGGSGEGILAGSKRIQNVLDPTAAQDAATRAYVLAQVGGSSQNTVRPYTTPAYVSVADASPGGVQSSSINVDFDRTLEFPTDLPPAYMRFMMGFSATNMLAAGISYSWLVEVWPLYNLNGPSLLNYRTRISIIDGTATLFPIAPFNKQNAHVSSAHGPYWGLTAGGLISSGTTATVATFGGSVQLRLTWQLDTPSVSFNRMVVYIQSDATGVYVDAGFVPMLLANI
jgi:hypothetical protein